MNREDVIRMARESGIEIDIWEPLYEGDSTGFRVCEFTHEELERFTKAVYAAGAAAEREACAKVCEEKQQYAMPTPCPDGIDGCLVMHSVPAYREKTGQECAAAIRARGNK